MGRIFSALIILLLAISHAPMSAALPHFDGTAHAHERVAEHEHDDHAASEVTDAEESAATSPDGDIGKAAHGTGHHVHIVSDGVPASNFSFAGRWFERDRQPIVNDAALLSAALDQPIEPPSA